VVSHGVWSDDGGARIAQDSRSSAERVAQEAHGGIAEPPGQGPSIPTGAVSSIKEDDRSESDHCLHSDSASPKTR